MKAMDDSRLTQLRFEREQKNEIDKEPLLRRKRSASLDADIQLNWAVSHNDVATVKSLVEREHVKLNEAGVDGMLPLHRAASTGSLECVKLLVQKGAKINVYDSNGISPLDVAVAEGEFECALYLINSGADINNIRDGFTDIQTSSNQKRR